MIAEAVTDLHNEAKELREKDEERRKRIAILNEKMAEHKLEASRAAPLL